ncbi:MAG: TrmH family RNA methyltransferase [Clostridia bacterium]|jgi:TrmH family RNA methyltransferase|nr:TrmH family RNA methyltransferase [Clostridia bacterium]MDD4275520.1 TrmH family RNA methyltransferase [Clostridia bacterium]
MIKTYKKEYDYSYTLGVFLTIELLKFKYEYATMVAIFSKTKDSDGIEIIKELCKEHHIKCEINDKQINNLSPKSNCYAVGFFKKYNCKINNKNKHIVLVNPSDSGNLGTIMRSMAGFTATDLAIIKPAVDIFDPKTIRASMGAIFHINFEYFDTFEKYKKLQPENRNFYPFMLSASKPLQDLKPQMPYSFIFGNESSGLTDNFKTVGQCVIIPHSTIIDSLNLQTAVAIALYSTSL